MGVRILAGCWDRDPKYLPLDSMLCAFEPGMKFRVALRIGSTWHLTHLARLLVSLVRILMPSPRERIVPELVVGG